MITKVMPIAMMAMNEEETTMFAAFCGVANESKAIPPMRTVAASTISAPWCWTIWLARSPRAGAAGAASTAAVTRPPRVAR
jgi:hypothetical protein